MSRNFGHPRKDDIDPKVKQFFPWALFLVCAGLLGLAAYWTGERNTYECYAQPGQAIFDGAPPCNHPWKRAVENYFSNTLEQDPPFWQCNGKPATNNPRCKGDGQ